MEADATYREALEAPGTHLVAAFAAASEAGPLELNGNDITVATLLRLRSFFRTQDSIKAQLDKVYASSAADFLVETLMFYLHVALARLAPNLSVASEKNIVRRRGSLRPDISIWQDTNVVAAIECKTQLGWNRDGWLHDFEDRETRLRVEHPAAKLFLLVTTASNWQGFGDDARVGQQFFVLLEDIWPRDFDENAPDTIVHRVEALISEVLRHAKG